MGLFGLIVLRVLHRTSGLLLLPAGALWGMSKPFRGKCSVNFRGEVNEERGSNV